jgi:D-sedoheptulose 7-phosphate isomerase
MKEPQEEADWIAAMVAESIAVKSRFFSQNAPQIAAVAERIAGAFQSGHKVLIFGNGGSAADAQHIASEFVGRFVVDRSPLPAVSLATDTSLLTSVSNDYGFENVFARQIAGLGQPADIAIAISTSGNSSNVLRAIEAARTKGMYTVGLSGESGGEMAGKVDVLFRVPSRHTPRIQETHIMIGHIICDLVDRLVVPDKFSRD